MTHEKRPESATPRMETRTFKDDEGRRWAGSVMSGRLAGGEQHGEVIFVCEDSPSEPKRSVRLEADPESAAKQWRGMEESGMRNLLRDSEPA